MRANSIINRDAHRQTSAVGLAGPPENSDMQVASPNPRRAIRFSLRIFFLLITLCCVAAWWWQRPYTVDSTQRLLAGIVDGEPRFSQGRRVESYRRQMFGDPMKHGPTRIYDEENRMLFEDHWRNGVRHGPYRKWEQPSGSLLAELEFDKGRLVRFGDTAVDDFMPRLSLGDPAGERIQAELNNETSFAYDNAPLVHVLEDIGFRHGIPIRLDTRALDKASIDCPDDNPCVRRARNTALCCTLRGSHPARPYVRIPIRATLGNNTPKWFVRRSSKGTLGREGWSAWHDTQRGDQLWFSGSESRRRAG